ncbi:MAG: 3'-5' exonuclease, partial [Eubacteriales bacterium]
NEEIEFEEGIERDEAIEFEEGIERDEAIEFEEGIELNEEIEFCGETGVGNETEILLVELQEDNKKTKDYAKEVEAKAIASKIHELLDDFQVTDKKSGELRKARYQDIVILLRTNSGWDEVFKRELNEAGIPVYIGSKTGYFSATEIKNIMNYLRIIDNPMQDIPLFGVMKSFFGNFTDAEIGWIKSRTCGKLYESLRFCVDSEEADLISLKRGMAEDGFVQQETSVIENVVSGILNLDLIAKIQQFLQRLERFREKVAYQPIHQLLQDLLDETGYLFYVSALPAGEQRTANVKMLLEKAIAFEKTSYFGLFHFIRYMEQMEKYDIDYGEANTLGEESDTVRIMSIHKSKGLEFPICFVAGITKRFNQMDANQNLVLDMDYGIGMDYIHEKDRIKRSDMRKSAISWKMKLDNLGEELRIFYVALTRAKEKLILTGAVEKLDKQLQAVAYLTDWENEKLPTNVRSSANHYFDFLLGALMRHPDFQKILIGKEMLVAVKKKQVLVAPKLKIQLISPESLIQERVEQGLLKENRRILLEEAVKENRKEQLLFQQLEEKFNFRYEKKILQKLSTKTTITELKKATMVEENEAYQDLFQEPELVPYIPKFKEKEENVVGTERGNAYHRVLELLQFDQLEDLHAYQQQMEVLVAKQRISKEYETLISSKKIMNFAHSNLGKRMVEAKKRNQLWKEQPFVMGVTANRLGEEFPETEQVLIQGIIDAYFIEEGEIVLVDYKTDRVKTKEELKSRYHVQLEYYKEALEKLTGLGVKESVIYSFALGKEISLV